MTGVRVEVDALVLLYAFRYALGRRTGAPSDIAAALIAHRDALPAWMRAQIVRDIADAIARGDAGAECDVDTWQRLLRAYGDRTAEQLNDPERSTP